MPVKVLLIPADMTKPLRAVDVPGSSDTDDKRGDFLRSLVGGYLQVIPCPTDEVSIWCNEEGKLMDLPLNERALVLWEQIWNQPIWDTLVGDVFVSGKTDRRGEMTSIAQSVIDALETATKS